MAKPMYTLNQESVIADKDSNGKTNAVKKKKGAENFADLLSHMFLANTFFCQ